MERDSAPGALLEALHAVAEDLRLIEASAHDDAAAAFARDLDFVRRALVLRLPAERWVPVLETLPARCTGALAPFAPLLEAARSRARRG